ncbi:MAG: hypothetical protein MZW92_61215 [Comamonadaceae bacterium]|nr:hypothetical protein [Comamonadaceae bacterium]
MEIRGLGIINIRAIFGPRSIARQAQVDLVVRLKKWRRGYEVDRLGLKSGDDMTMLGPEDPPAGHPGRPGPQHRHADRGRLQGPHPPPEGLQRAGRDHPPAGPRPDLRDAMSQHRARTTASSSSPACRARARPWSAGPSRTSATTASTTCRPSSSGSFVDLWLREEGRDRPGRPGRRHPRAALPRRLPGRPPGDPEEGARPPDLPRGHGRGPGQALQRDPAAPPDGPAPAHPGGRPARAEAARRASGGWPTTSSTRRGSTSTSSRTSSPSASCGASGRGPRSS